MSITIVFGKYAGFHLARGVKAYRICLGWMAISLYLYDFEKSVAYLMDRNAKLSANQRKRRNKKGQRLQW